MRARASRCRELLIDDADRATPPEGISATSSFSSWWEDGSPDGSRIATSCLDNQLRIGPLFWDLLRHCNSNLPAGRVVNKAPGLEHGRYRVRPAKQTKKKVMRILYRRFGHSARLFRPTSVEHTPLQLPQRPRRQQSKYGQWYSEMLPPMIPIALLAATVYGVRKKTISVFKNILSVPPYHPSICVGRMRSSPVI